ncbi:hypothetical protein EON62_03310, partial [archaeon]
MEPELMVTFVSDAHASTLGGTLSAPMTPLAATAAQLAEASSSTVFGSLVTDSTAKLSPSLSHILSPSLSVSAFDLPSGARAASAGDTTPRSRRASLPTGAAVLPAASVGLDVVAASLYAQFAVPRAAPLQAVVGVTPDSAITGLLTVTAKEMLYRMGLGRPPAVARAVLRSFAAFVWVTAAAHPHEEGGTRPLPAEWANDPQPAALSMPLVRTVPGVRVPSLSDSSEGSRVCVLTHDTAPCFLDALLQAPHVLLPSQDTRSQLSRRLFMLLPAHSSDELPPRLTWLELMTSIGPILQAQAVQDVVTAGTLLSAFAAASSEALPLATARRLSELDMEAGMSAARILWHSAYIMLARPAGQPPILSQQLMARLCANASDTVGALLEAAGAAQYDVDGECVLAFQPATCTHTGGTTTWKTVRPLSEEQERTLRTLQGAVESWVRTLDGCPFVLAAALKALAATHGDVPRTMELAKLCSALRRAVAQPLVNSADSKFWRLNAHSRALQAPIAGAAMVALLLSALGFQLRGSAYVLTGSPIDDALQQSTAPA